MKKAGSGLLTPIASLIAITSTSTPSASSSDLAPCGLVGGDRDAIAGGPQGVDGADGVGIEVLGAKFSVALLERRLPVAPVGLLQQLEEATPVLGPLAVRDRSAEHGHQGELRQAEDLGPGAEDACLVDQRLPDVQAHPSFSHCSEC